MLATATYFQTCSLKLLEQKINTFSFNSALLSVDGIAASIHCLKYLYNMLYFSGSDTVAKQMEMNGSSKDELGDSVNEKEPECKKIPCFEDVSDETGDVIYLILVTIH